MRVDTSRTDTPGNSFWWSFKNSTTPAGASFMMGTGWYGLYCRFSRSALIWVTLMPVSDDSAPLIAGSSAACARDSCISVVVTLVTMGCPSRSTMFPRAAGMLVVRSALDSTVATEDL